MGKHYEEANVKRLILKSVECDDCGKECKNTHSDVLVKMSFCEKADFKKTICFDCYEKQFKKKEKV